MDSDRVNTHIKALLSYVKTNDKPPLSPPPSTPELHLIPQIIDAAFSYPSRSVCHLDIQSFLNLLVIPTVDTSKTLSDNFRSASGPSVSGVCGLVWSSNEYAYKCRTCERDPTCVICHDCFHRGNHKGHDYALIRTGGGCCDCGDPQAWRRDGFCSLHRGPCSESDNPLASIEPHFLQRLNLVVETVAAHIAKLAANAHVQVNKHGKDAIHLIARLLDLISWLISVAWSDAMCRAIGDILTEQGKPFLMNILHPNGIAQELELDRGVVHSLSWLSFLMRLDGIDRLPHSVQKRLYDLYFSLIKDTVFKRNFFQCFIQHYERFTHAHVHRLFHASTRNNHEYNNSDPDIIQNFSVQLFTVPALVPLMVQEGGLIDVMLRVLLNLCEISATPLQCDSGVPYDRSAFAAKYPLSSDPLRAYRQNSSDLDTAMRRRASTPVAASSSTNFANINRGNTNNNTAAPTLPTPHTRAAPIQMDDGRNTRAENDNAQRNENAAPDGDFRPSVDDDNLPDQGLHAEMVDRVREDADANTETADTANLPAEFGPEHQPIETEDALLDEITLEVIEEVAANDGLFIINGTTDARENANENPTNTAFDDDDASPPADFVMQLVSPDDGDGDNDWNTNDDDNDNRNHEQAQELTQHEETGEEGGNNAIDGQNQNETNFINARTFSGQIRIRSRRQIKQQQAKAFEDGLHFVPSSFTRIVSTEAPKSLFMKAVTRARATENAALNGTDLLPHPLRFDLKMDEKIDVINNLILRILGDLRFVFAHEAAAFHFLHVRARPFRTLLRILSIAQGMIPYHRRFGDHVLASTEEWSRAFRLESDIYRLFDLMADVFCTRSATKFAKVLGPEVSADMDMAASRRRLVCMVRSCLDRWLLREQAVEALETYDGEEFTVAHGQSVYLPLHRLLAFFAHHIVRVDGVTISIALGLQNRGSQTLESTKRLLTHPLRLQSFFAQVRAGMWRRNGQPVAGQAYLYTKWNFSEWFVELDLFLLQCCAVLLGPSSFVREAMRAFRIKNLSSVIDLINRGTEEEIIEQQRERASQRAIRTRLRQMMEAREQRRQNAEENNEQATARTGESEDESTRTPSSALFATDDEGSIFGLLPLAPRLFFQDGTISGVNVVPTLGNTKSEMAKFMQSVVEELLVLLVRVASDRSRCGQSKLQLLHSRIIHELAPSDKYFSVLKARCSFVTMANESRVLNEEEKLTDNGDDDELTESTIESVLRDVADYIPPKGMTQGAYCLKTNAWKEFDPFFPHLSRRERCYAEVRHSSVGKATPGYSAQAIPIEKICNRPLYKSFEQLYEIPSLLCAEGSEALVAIFLQKSVPKEGVNGYWVGLMAAVSNLMCMYVESKSSDTVSKWLTEISESVELFSKSAVGSLCQTASVLQTSHSSLFVEFKPVLERIIRQIYHLGDTKMKNLLFRNAPSVLPESVRSAHAAGASSSAAVGSQTQTESEEMSAEKRRKLFLKKKKEQQAAAMKKMREAQNRFVLSINETGGDKSDEKKPESMQSEPSPAKTDSTAKSTEEDESEHIEQCVLCHSFTRSGERNGLLGMIGFQQPTRIPIIAQRTCDSLPRTGHVFHGRGRFVNEDLGRGTETDIDTATATAATATATMTRNDSECPKTSGCCSKSVIKNSDNGIESSKKSNSQPEYNEFPLGEVGLLSSMNEQVIRQGMEKGRAIHVALCGHTVHVDCFEAYFNSLLRSKSNRMAFAGSEVVNLDKKEFLCPVCRRLSNLILPTVDRTLMKNNDAALSRRRNDNSVDTDIQMSEKHGQYESWITSRGKEIEEESGNPDGLLFSIGNNVYDNESKHRHYRHQLEGYDNMAAFIEASARLPASSSSSGVLYLGDVDDDNIDAKGDFSVRVIDLMKIFRFTGKETEENETVESESSETETRMYEVLGWFAHCIISTTGCLEIAFRKVDCDAPMMYQARQSIRNFAQVTRDHLNVEDGMRARALRILWKFMQDKSSGKGRDAYVCTSLLMLLWPGRVDWEEAKMLIRFGYDVLLHEVGVKVINQTDNDHCIELMLKTLMFCRRAVLLVYSIMKKKSASSRSGDGVEGKTMEERLRLLRTYGRVINWERAKQETIELMELFELGECGGAKKAIESIKLNEGSDISSTGDQENEKVRKVKRIGFLPIQIGLINLKREYAVLLEDVQDLKKWKCSVCEMDSKPRVMCLICGALMCREKTCGEHARRGQTGTTRSPPIPTPVTHTTPTPATPTPADAAAPLATTATTVETETNNNNNNHNNNHNHNHNNNNGLQEAGIRIFELMAGTGMDEDVNMVVDSESEGEDMEGEGNDGDEEDENEEGNENNENMLNENMLNENMLNENEFVVDDDDDDDDDVDNIEDDDDNDDDDNDDNDNDDDDDENNGRDNDEDGEDFDRPDVRRRTDLGGKLLDGMSLHAMQCGGGVGVLLNLEGTSVEIRRWKRLTEWGLLYLDLHGEGDELLSNGRALFLCESRYATLERLWLQHAFDQDSYILSHGLRDHPQFGFFV